VRIPALLNSSTATTEESDQTGLKQTD